MSKTNTFENDIQLHIFNNVAIADIGDVSGLPASATPGSLYIGLITAVTDGEAGTVTEATFGSYARQAVARASGAGGWTVTNNVATNFDAVTFPEATSGNETITHFGIWDSLTTGTLLYWGTVGTNRTVTTGVTVEFAAGAITVTED